MNKPARWWIFFGYINASPHTLGGLLFALAFYKIERGSWEWRDGVLTCVGDPWGTEGGQTHGFLTIYETEDKRQRPDLRVHENCHVWWAMVLGLLYLALYIAMFIAARAMHPLSGLMAAYRAIWFERQASERQRQYLAGGRDDAWGAK